MYIHVYGCRATCRGLVFYIPLVVVAYRLPHSNMQRVSGLHTIGCSGIQAPTSVTVICTRRGLEKSMDGV